jgi:integrase
VQSAASPVQERKQERQAERTARMAGTVANLAERYVDHLAANNRKAQSVRWHVEAYIVPRLGKVRSPDLTADQIRRACDRIKDVDGAPASAREVLGTIKRMLQFGVDSGLITANAALTIKPSVYAAKSVRERSLSVEELRSLVTALGEQTLSPTASAALQFILLTMARKNEAIKAPWSEIDLDAATWLLPQERTKNKKPHLVPLSIQAIAILEKLRPDADNPVVAYGDWVFPGIGGRPLADTTLNEALSRAKWFGIPRFTVHDLRRTASTILHEQGWNTDVIEKALNHTMKGVRGVYNKAEYLDQRREMLQAWADYLDALKAGAKVVPIRKTTTA